MEGELVLRKRYVVEKRVQSCLGESCSGPDKILVVRILCRGNGTVQKGSLLGCSGESRRPSKKWKVSWCGENGTWRKKNCRNLFWGKLARDGQNSTGVYFLGRERHVAERKPPRLIG
ncbi:hypothetical protein T10_3316 [Trichinella papuae]|uniref:Uncharacterized protein n=1 Tax=Trichinella papuae TaxID=268474 RepID=A0A0V1M4M5_9BILA|nr:hypothetical protein T10_3316 [Trichinella papuae]